MLIFDVKEKNPLADVLYAYRHNEVFETYTMELTEQLTVPLYRIRFKCHIIQYKIIQMRFVNI